MFWVGSMILVLSLEQIAEVTAVGECIDSINPLVSPDVCSGNGNCVDFGYYGTYTCLCDPGYHGKRCEDIPVNGYGNIDQCDAGNVEGPNAVIESNNYPGPLDHQTNCYILVNIHGATVTNITVEFFNFETNRDTLDFGLGYTILNPEDAGYSYFHNTNPFTSRQIPSGAFWFVTIADRTISSSGFRIVISGDGNDCLLYLEPCLNGGTCIDGWQRYTCQCPVGFEGNSCEISTSDSAPSDPSSQSIYLYIGVAAAVTVILVVALVGRIVRLEIKLRKAVKMATNPPNPSTREVGIQENGTPIPNQTPASAPQEVHYDEVYDPSPQVQGLYDEPYEPPLP